MTALSSTDRITCLIREMIDGNKSGAAGKLQDPSCREVNMSLLQKRFSHSPNVVGRLIEGEVIIVPVSGDISRQNSIFSLEDTAAQIWTMMDGKKSVGDILDCIVATKEVAPEQAQADLVEFLDELVGLGAIEESGDIVKSAEPIEPPDHE